MYNAKLTLYSLVSTLVSCLAAMQNFSPSLKDIVMATVSGFSDVLVVFVMWWSVARGNWIVRSTL